VHVSIVGNNTDNKEENNMTTKIVGYFEEKSFNTQNVLNEVLNTAQAQSIQYAIAHYNRIPVCRVGSDERGISVVSLEHNKDVLVWRRGDYTVHDIQDMHSLCPVYAFDRPGPSPCDTTFELTKTNVDYCKNKYSVGMSGGKSR